MDVHSQVQQLILLFILQLTEGCGNSKCPATTCYSHRVATSDRPLRRYTELSARAAAFHLATLDNPFLRLCPLLLSSSEKRNGNLSPGVERNEGVFSNFSEASKSEKDMKSYSQQIFDTQTVKDFLIKPQISGRHNSNTLHELEMSCSMIQQYTHSTPEWASLGVAAIMTSIKGIANLLPNLRFEVPLEVMQMEYDVAFEDDTIFAFARRLTTMMSDLSISASHVCECGLCARNRLDLETTEAMRTMLEAQFRRSDQSFWHLNDAKKRQRWMALRHDEFAIPVPMTEIFVTVQCATRVLSRTWDGDSNVRFHSIAGQAVRVLSMLYDMLGRLWPQSPISKFFDDTFRWRTLKPMEYARQYAEKGSGKISLLDYPWLFSKPSQVLTFRGLCFRRMERTVEDAHLNLRLLVSGMAWQSQDPPEVRQLVNGQLRTATARSFALQVSREHLLDDVLDQIWRRELREILRPLRVEIINKGEEGLDQGGVAQEMFQAALTTVLDPSYGMFTVDPMIKMTWFAPATVEPLYKYELLGVLFALAIHNGFVLPVTFPRVFYEKLLPTTSPALSPYCIEDGWPTLAGSFNELLEWSEGDVGDIFVRQYAFSIEAYGEVIHVDMTKPHTDAWTLKEAKVESDMNALQTPLVTNENRAAFVKDYISWLTDKSIRAQFSAFAQGFHSVLPPHLLATITSSALQILTEGHQMINMEDLEAATNYEGGYTSSSRTIRDFWSVVHAYDAEQKRSLLEFITASDRLPVNGARGVRLLIQRNGGDSERLPTAMTCFATLLLPEYKDKERLRAKLNVVLGEARGFGLR